MTTPTLDTVTPTASTGTTVVPRRRRHLVAPALAAILGAALARGTTWLMVTVVSLDMTPGSVGF
jgi:hypothetical protein